jgi:hypothetical protein
MKKLSFLLVTLVAVNMFGQKNPNSNRKTNSNEYSNFFEYEKNTQRKVDNIDVSNFKEKVQIVNIAETLGKTFIIEGKAYILLQDNIMLIGKVNSEGRIDTERKVKFQKLDDNCISEDNGNTCFTIRSKTMLPELIRVSDGKTISIGYWKNKEFHEFLLKWKNK